MKNVLYHSIRNKKLQKEKHDTLIALRNANHKHTHKMQRAKL